MNERAAPVRLDRRLQAVESSADFEFFFRSERPRLYGSMLLITGSTHEADELVQEAFFKVWERWDRVGSMEDPTGYLFRTALNAQHSAYRRAVRANRRSGKRNRSSPTGRSKRTRMSETSRPPRR